KRRAATPAAASRPAEAPRSVATKSQPRTANNFARPKPSPRDAPINNALGASDYEAVLFGGGAVGTAIHPPPALRHTAANIPTRANYSNESADPRTSAMDG